MSVHVIIISGKKCELKSLFNDSFYDITVIEEKQMINTNDIMSLDEYNENYNYSKALKIAKKDNRPCLIIKDTSITLLSTEQIKNYIIELLNIDTDLCFLSTWRDECYKYTDYNNQFKWCQGSISSQAILYKTLNGKKAIQGFTKSPLSTILKNIKVKEIACVPNLFSYDITKAKSNDDYLKLNCCVPVPIIKSPENTTNNAAWILIIILFIVLLAVLVPYLKTYGRL
jgi:hypothetical protein